MNRHRLTRYAIVVASVFALGAIGAFAAREVAAESAQAHALVNLGKTALAAGERASAVLSFERAQLLAPRADFVRSALAAAGVPAAGPSIDGAVSWITPREWAILAEGFGWMTGLSLAVVIARSRSGALTLTRRLAIGSAVAFVLSVGGVVESNLSSQSLAVVTTPTGALVAPYEASGATADLRAGDVVRVGERFGHFVRVRGRVDAEGWVASGALHSVVGAGA
jgi:hypothetical protein